MVADRYPPLTHRIGSTTISPPGTGQMDDGA